MTARVTAIPQPKIREMVDRIAAEFHPAKIILFGSHARGTADADSDVDLLVVMPIMGSRRQQAVAIEVKLGGIGLSKDVVIVTPEEFERFRDVVGSIVYPAAHDGRIVYEQIA